MVTPKTSIHASALNPYIAHVDHICVVKDGGLFLYKAAQIGGLISSRMCESRIEALGNDFHMECLWFCFARIIQD